MTAAQALRLRVVADVKCYYCGHISGQVIGRKHEPLRVSNFVPRQGYAGEEVKPGKRLRCERCHGPVFLEDATNSAPLPRIGPRTRPQDGALSKSKGKAA